MSTTLRIRRTVGIIECPCYRINPLGAESPVLTVKVGAWNTPPRWAATCLPTDARATRVRMMTGAGIRALASRRTLPATAEMQAYDFACDGYLGTPWGSWLCDGQWHPAQFEEDQYDLKYNGEIWKGPSQWVDPNTYSSWQYELDALWQGEAGPWRVTVRSRHIYTWAGRDLTSERTALMGREGATDPLSVAGPYNILVGMRRPDYSWREPTPTEIEQAGYVVVRNA